MADREINQSYCQKNKDKNIKNCKLFTLLSRADSETARRVGLEEDDGRRRELVACLLA